MENENPHPDTQRILADGIAAALSKDGDMPLRWVAVVESMDPEGQRCIWRFNSDGMAMWDTLSLLEYGITKERAALMRAELES